MRKNGENSVAHFKRSATHSVEKSKCKPSDFSKGNFVTVLTKRKAEKTALRLQERFFLYGVVTAL